MAIVSTDIKLRLSGGASNADPLASIGGAKSSVEVGAALFGTVSGAESTAGDTEHRCIYVHNGHATLSMESAVAYVDLNTPSPSTEIRIGVGAAGVNATESAIGDVSTAPAGVTFSLAASLGTAIALGTIPPGQHRAVWYRRVVIAGAAALNVDNYSLTVVCDTAE